MPGDDIRGRTVEEREIDEALGEIRANPTIDRDVVERKIEPMMDRVLQYLVQLDEKEASAGKQLHLFCPKAPPTVRESATFLLRLHAYEASNTNGWLDRVWKAIMSCYDCSRGHEEAKQRARATYLSAYPATRLGVFMSSIDTWERERLLAEYKTAGFTSMMPSDDRTIATASPHLLYHALVNTNLLKTPIENGISKEELSLSALLKNFPPGSRIDDFPAKPPAGIALLFFHEDEKLRNWAQRQMSNVVISAADIQGWYGPVLQVLADCLEGKVDNNWASASSSFFAQTKVELWSGLYSLLQAFSPEAVTALFKLKDRDWIHFLTRHLHDNEPHFPPVLQSFVHVLNEVTTAFWASDAPEFPEVVFDSIKDNPAFNRLLEADAHVEEPWFLTCFQIFLLSVWDKPCFDSILAKVINFMSEELQHPRFEPPCRALVMQVVLATMTFVHQEAVEKGEEKRRETTAQVFSIQATNIAAVAYAKQYRDAVWARARQQASSLLEAVFTTDTNVLQQATFDMASIREQAFKSKPAADVDVKGLVEQLNKLRHLVLHPALWDAVRLAVPMSDGQGFGFFMRAVAPSLHLGLDREHAFHEAEILGDSVLRKTFRNAVEKINEGLGAVRKDFSTMLSAFAEASTSDSIKDLLSSSSFAHTIVQVILCPLEDISLAAQDIVTQASFAMERMEIFRFLLQTSPAATIDGITEYIRTFNSCAPAMPEICSMARWMIRCLADVLEALCDPMYGVLRQDTIVNNADLPKRIFGLWRGMCKASAAIFKHTPSWARFYASNIMTDWMRDALIFIRDLVKNLQVFESAMQGSSKQADDDASPTKIKLSNLGKKCVSYMNEVLYNLVAWLRLTDPETLHQSTELICELLKMYRRTAVDPPKEAIETIEKYTSGAKSRGKLTREQLSSLGDAISPFTVIEVPDDDDEEEITFVSHAPPKVSEPTRSKPVAGPSEPAVPKSLIEAFKKTQPPKVNGFKKPDESKKDILSSAPLISGAAIRERSAPKKLIGRGPPAKSASLIGQMRQDFKRERQSTRAAAPIQPKHTQQPKRREPKNEGGRPVKVTGESESSDEGSSDVETGLDFLSKLQKSPAKFRPIAAKPPPKPERRQVQLVGTSNKTFNPYGIQPPSNTEPNPYLERLRQREEQARRQKRLKPDLGPFTRQVLLWDYESTSETPPFPPDKRPKLSQIPWSFQSYDEFRRIFEPLLLYECWSGIIKSKEETAQQIFRCDVGARSNTDDWLDLDVAINTDTLPSNFFLTDNDVVFLKQHLGSKSVLAKVESFRRSPRGMEARFRCCLGYDPRGLNQAFQIRTQWRAQKVFSFTTIYREFGALQALPLYDLCDDILKPKPARLPSFPDAEIKAAVKAFDVNEPQAKAILGSVQTDGFSLIQGPPGTGKTKTICGLVGNWISKRAMGPPPGQQEDRSLKPKLLICAPSNAAIDEVAKRLMEGVRTTTGQRKALNVVRVGNDTSINVSVKDVSLDELIERKINGDPSLKFDRNEIQGTIADLRRDIDAVNRDLETKSKDAAEVQDNSARSMTLDAELRALRQKRMALTSKLNQTRDKQKDAGRSMDAARRRFRQEVLDEADVICCTLSGSGHDVLASYDFETVIIDEAGQSVEVSSLIPLKYQCKRCILVGDPQQLPPTVLSQMAEQHGYARSLFVRIMRARPEAVHLLSIQYRMHPEISKLDSDMFYDSKLKDGPGMAEKTAQPWHVEPLFSPYRFFDVDGRETKARIGHSIVNDTEAEMILQLVKRLRNQFTAINFDYRIGIVTMYREQMFKLRRLFQDAFGGQILTTIDFNTVDGFQGQEKDIIILSCVRAGSNQGSVGFLADKRRTNVAITRARSSLFIFGNAPTLERSDAIWKSIVQNARERNVLTKAEWSTFRQHHTVSAIPPARKSTTPRKPKAEAARPPPPDLMTPQQLAKTKLTANGKTVTEASPPARNVPLEDGEISAGPSQPLKRKASDEGPRRPPPALRPVQPQNNQAGPSSATVPKREPSGTVASPTTSKKRKTPPAGQRESQDSRTPNKRQNHGNNAQRPGGDNRRNGGKPPPQSRPPIPTLGNPISVPSNDPAPRPRFGGPRPPQRLPQQGDGTTSQTMFIPKKRPNNPNAQSTGPSNIKQRLMQEARQQPR